MRRTLASIAFALITCAAVNAQVIQTSFHPGAKDPWGQSFDTHKKLTITGLVTGVEVSRPSTRDDEQVAVLIKSKNRGGTTVVELGPKWYLDEQIAKVHTYDEVQITGSQVMSGGQGIIVASMVLIGGQGGPVLTLRHISGKAYWMPDEVAEKPSTQDVLASSPINDGTLMDLSANNYGQGPTPPRMLQSNDGFMNIDLGQLWWGPQDSLFRVDGFTNVVAGPYPITLGPNLGNFPGGRTSPF